MVAMTMFANVATTSRSYPLRFSLYGHGVGAVIADHFGGDGRTTALRRKEGVHIAFGFFTGYPGPMVFDSGLEEVEISVSHTYIPYNTLVEAFVAGLAQIGNAHQCSRPDCSGKSYIRRILL